MKRFITYFYLYENGAKTINVGFARVDIRNQSVNMEISLRNLSRFQESGKIYALVDHNGLVGVELGEMRIFNGQGSKQVTIEAVDIMGSGYGMDDVVGMSIRFGNKGYIASCWKDEYADAISGGVVRIQPWIPPQLEEMQPEVFDVEIREEEPITVEVEPVISEIEQAEMEMVEEKSEITSTEVAMTSYKKIDLNQIHSLPSKNWYLCNNSFLIHGFWNYGYLVLKKKMEKGQEKLSLGIPGIFEKPEMVMAILFGFPEFEALPPEMKEENKNIEKSFPAIEKNQEPKTGDFGCWFVDLKI